MVTGNASACVKFQVDQVTGNRLKAVNTSIGNGIYGEVKKEIKKKTFFSRYIGILNCILNPVI